MSETEVTTLGPLQLNAIEARVLGCLVEKEATTPDIYPLTLNSLLTACNQKTSRDPIMALSLGEVGHAVRQMEQRGLVRSVHGARVERYEHRMDKAYGLTMRKRALLCLLLLRGPQTLAELLTRSERIADFLGVDDVRDSLQLLIDHEPSYALCLARAPGQREDRYMHLLCGPVDASAYAAMVARDSQDGAGSSLAQRIAELEQRVQALEQRLEEALPGSPDQG